MSSAKSRSHYMHAYMHPSQHQLVVLYIQMRGYSQLHPQTSSQLLLPQCSYISIQSKLSWTSHVDYISHKANHFLGFLTQNRKNSPTYFKEQLAIQLYMPSYIATNNYMQSYHPLSIAALFGILTMQKYFIDKLEMIQHRTACFVPNKPWNRHQCDSMHYQLTC